MKRCFILLLLFSANLSAQKAGTDSTSVQSLPSIPFLPLPLMLNEGGKNIPVKTATQWNQKRSLIREQYQYWISGSVPPSPGTFHSTVLHEKVENGIRLKTVELRFGPGDKAKMTVELMIPLSSKPLPVFMTQWNHRGWAQVAVRRGYIGCVYAGADINDDTRNYAEVFPGYDFATLMKRAWGASRVIDYLYMLPEVDTAKIAITGHSRNGKQSLMAAAFDDRIKAVVSSSGGTGGESTFRWSDDRFTPGSFDRMVQNQPNWFSFRLPWFIGKEDKLPVDQNSLMSLIAPRGLMLVSAITEDEGNPWGVGQSYQSVKEVYHFMQADSKVAILLRPGRHQHAARDAESFLDFFDFIFGRSRIPPENKLYYNYSFDHWKQVSGERIDPLKFPANTNALPLFQGTSSFAEQQDSARQRIRWLLGDEPPGIHEELVLSPFLKKNSSYPDDYLEEVIGEAALPAGIKKMAIGPYSPLGDDLWGNIYFPAGVIINDSVSDKQPLLIYLHEHSYATGYHKKSLAAIRHFTAQGFAVLAMDMMGFGTRIEEALRFYERYPNWSVMGKMVADTRSVIDDVCKRMPFIDSSNIYLAGYSLGGTVALFTAALDNRVKGTAAVSSFSSLRNDNVGTEGIRHYSHLHGLLPRLGFFVGQEARIPVDFDDIIACTAPRPLLIMAPKQDRDHTIESVRNTVSSLTALYKRSQVPGNITVEEPDTYNNFTDSLQQKVAAWLFQRKIPVR
ncbi:MAG: alpha/beta fold hydrolase [Chitinophagaceae bacterium]